MASTKRFRYKRRPTLELSVVALLVFAAFIVATFVITNRADAPADHANQLAGHWTPQFSGTTVDLLDIDFADSRHGWAVGESGTILHTANRGDTWQPQNTGTDAKLVGVDFVNTSEGWAVGLFGTILHTSDGGNTWETQGSDATLGINLVGVSFVDSRNGWVITERGSAIFRTDDGGVTWNRENFASDSVRSDVTFVDRTHGWVVLSGGAVLRTSDGGSDWQHQNIPGAGLNGGYFRNENDGWIAGWRRKPSGLQFSEFLIDGMVARTTDGGKSWATYESGTGNFLWDVSFINSNEGWAVGGLGTILYSSDSGITWTPQSSGTQETLRKVIILNEDLGWAIGSNGIILQFTRQ